MRAFVITAPGEAGVQDVEPPVATPGEVVVDVERAGVCGTDVEFYTGEMAYLHQRPRALPDAHRARMDGHGRRRSATAWTRPGSGAASPATRCSAAESAGGASVATSTCASSARRSASGAAAPARSPSSSRCRRAHFTGCRTTWTPRSARSSSPPATRCARSKARRSAPGDRVLVLGPGAIGLLCAMFARAAGAEVHLLGRSARSIEFARDARVRACLGRGRPARPAVRRRDRRLELAGPAREGARGRRARRAGRLRRPGRQPQPHRHPRPRAEGRHRGRHPERARPGSTVRSRRSPRGASTRARSSPRRSGSRSSRTCSAGGGPTARATGRRSTSTRGSADRRPRRLGGEAARRPRSGS